MDFMNRGGRPVQQNTQTPTMDSAPGPKASDARLGKLKDRSKLSKIAYVAFVVAVTVLVLAVVASLVAPKNSGNGESAYVKTDKLQAVFLNGGQVYFGKIGELNSK